MRLRDTALATVLGSRTDQGHSYKSLADAIYGPPDISLAGMTFWYVAATRMTEVDDIDLVSCTTPGAIVVPLLLALAQHGYLDGMPQEEILDLIVKGYQVVTGLSRAIGGPYLLAEGVWPTLAVGSIAVAAVSGLAMGFDFDDIERAVILASYMSQDSNPRGNSREVILAGTAVAGLEAALAVRHKIFVAEDGYLAPFHALLEGRRLGRQPLSMSDLISFAPPAVERAAIKHFCSARQVMTAVAASQLLTAGHKFSVSDIDAIQIAVPLAYARMVDRGVVESRRESLSSVQYQIAAALLDPVHLMDVGRRRLRTDTEFIQLMNKVNVQAAPDLDVLYPIAWPARVTFDVAGHRYQHTSDTIPVEDECSLEAVDRKVDTLSIAPNALDAHTSEVLKSFPGVTDSLASWRSVSDLIDGYEHNEGLD
ncbi:MAG: hypothetical protein HKL84_07915 [Acidimicrobiaceae bacterium]|nr:hypothetical protein [Acidimicrobiaceae bacterium]